MRRKPAVLILALALAAFAALGIAACGSSDSTTSASTSSTAEETTSAAAGSTIDVEADPGGQLAYTTGDLEASAGTVEIAFDNPSSTGHDVHIESSSGDDLGGTDVITASTTTADVDLKPGTYTYYCSVDSHRDAGMEGTLTVK